MKNNIFAGQKFGSISICLETSGGKDNARLSKIVCILLHIRKSTNFGRERRMGSTNSMSRENKKAAEASNRTFRQSLPGRGGQPGKSYIRRTSA